MSAPPASSVDQVPASGASPSSPPPKPEIPETAILSTERWYLRPFEVSDAPSLAKAANDTELTRYMRARFPSPYTLSDAHSWIAHCRSQPILAFGIFLTSTAPEDEGGYVGSVSLEPPTGDVIYAGTRELGYYVARKFWGQGIMSHVVQEFTRWAFATHPDLLRIEASVFGPNAGSKRVLQKAGFVKEGTRRLAIVKEGKQMDEDIFGLIRTDITA